MSPIVETLLFVVAIPLVHQLIKLAADKYAFTLAKWHNQCLGFVLTCIAFAVSGGFAGLTVPVYAGDPIAFVGAFLVVISPIYASIMALYEVVFARLFSAVNFVTYDQL